MRFAILLTLVAACSDLPDIPSGVCGNGAVDSSEDCDGASETGTCGAPSTANACHFVCDGSATCPDGFTCGADARCRAPGGLFQPAHGPFSFGATELRAGDVDGDGFDDLVGVEAGRVETRFGTTSGDLSASADQVLPESTGTVAIGNVDDDKLLDLVVPTSLGLVTMRGTNGRAFDPFPYASLDLSQSSGEVHVEAVQAFADFGVAVLIGFDNLDVGNGQAIHSQLRAVDGVLGTCLDGTLTGPPPFPTDCAPSPALGDLLGGNVAIGRTGFHWVCNGCTDILGAPPGFKPLASDDSDEAVIALKGATSVSLLSAIEAGVDATTLTMRPVQSIAMPAGHPVADDGAIAFADMDGDGCNDLVIPAQGVGGGTVFAISYNDCTTGTMAAAVLVTASDVLPAETGLGLGIVRAAVDLDGNGVADIVTDKQIILTIAAGKGAGKWKGAGIALPQRAWTSAVAVDINHDGVTDIAAIVDGDPDVDIFLNDRGLFNDFTVATADPVRFVVTGDFDGDLVTDVGFVTGDTSADEDDSLEVVFGSFEGGPSAPVDQGHYGIVRSISPLSLDTSVATLDGIEDLLVVTDTTAGRKGALALGATDRQLVAPFLVSGPNSSSSSVPLGVIDGQFDTTAPTDLLAIAKDPAETDGSLEPVQVFLMSGTGGGELANVALYNATTDLHSLFAKPNPLFAHGALDASGIDSVVIAHSPNSASTSCPADATTLIATPPPPPGIQPYTQATSWNVPPPQPVPALAGNCQRVHALQMADLDADGIAETLIDVCDASPGGHGNCVGAILPTANGTVQVGQAVTLPPTDLSCGRFAPIQLDTDADLELAGACGDDSNNAFLVLLDNKDGAWVELVRIPIASQDGRITVGDFNGDKVPDVAIASGAGGATTVNIYLQCAKGDPSCAPQ